MTSGHPVLIIGGGIAGLTTATRLLEAGCQVHLVESRSVLGGRASSFQDPDSGEWIDNCQHVLMRCCTNLMDWYERIGVADQIQFASTYTFLARNGHEVHFGPAPLPAPLHLVPALLRFHVLSLRARVAVLRAMFRILMTTPERAASLSSMPFAEWLERAHQPPQAIDRFWRVILVSALNEDVERIATPVAFQMFRDGFMLNRRAHEMGLPTVRLAELYHEFGGAHLRRQGAQVNTGCAVKRLDVEDGRVVRAEYRDGSSSDIRGDVVLALPWYRIRDLLPNMVLADSPFWDGLAQMEASPITGVHLWFDRPVMQQDYLAVLDRDIQWIFNKNQQYGEGDSGTYISVVVSASRQLVTVPRDALIRQMLDELQEILPAVRDASIVKSRVVKEKYATFSPAPGVEHLRPGPQTPLENVLVAGDWTDTGWPATMEGAARSGYACAERLMERAGQPQRFLVNDLPVQGLARWCPAGRVNHHAQPGGTT